MAGYSFKELIGANHNIIRHPDMPKLAYKNIIRKNTKQKRIFCFVKNLCADGGYYWVFAYITPDLDVNGNIISYTSVRRKAMASAIEQIMPLYKTFLDAERSGSIQASEKLLQELLQKHDLTYNELITNLQKGAQL